MAAVIKVENLSKAYQLGQIGTGTLSRDLERFWAKMRGKEDPFLKIGEINDRSTKGESDIVWGLKDLNFEIEQGAAVGIIGRNGAGKSTLLKILSRVTSPTTGSVKIRGRVASLLEVGTGFHPELSGRENIFLNGAILGMRKAEIKRKFDEMVDFSGVERYIDTPVKRYSSGMYVRLAFAVAAHLESEILIVDEVLAVGDAEFQKKCVSKMGQVSSKEKKTVLFVSHNLSMVQNLCKTGILLNNGSIEFSGTSEKVIDYYRENINFLKPERFILINKTHRQYDHLRTIEFISVEYDDNKVENQFATDESLTVILTVKANKSFENFRIAGSISKMDETCIGVFFSKDNLKINAGETKRIRLTIKNHHIAKGSYYLDFSIGLGNEITGIKDFDIITKTLTFEIIYKEELTKEMYLMWDNNWGAINFQDTEVNFV
ncbi:MAG TPA: polysaccharide ABC transporter ATP-binding protein [Mucilaginibacter sp.]|jgi:lipopolysaccharide transport system ATP-binding protein|nr:polysaccharide ABC transporter ATP-binding protein [Mucilaginibacter sp.]